RGRVSLEYALAGNDLPGVRDCKWGKIATALEAEQALRIKAFPMSVRDEHLMAISKDLGYPSLHRVTWLFSSGLPLLNVLRAYFAKFSRSGIVGMSKGPPLQSLSQESSRYALERMTEEIQAVAKCVAAHTGPF